MLYGESLWDLIEKRVDATPDALMAVDEDMRTVTFSEFVNDAEMAAAGLIAGGVSPGDVVSWQLPTWIESMTLAAALSRIGAVQNPILPMYRQRDLVQMTRAAGSKLLVVPGFWNDFDYEEMAVEVALENPGLRLLVMDRALPQGDTDMLPEPPDHFDPARVDRPPTPQWIFFTSGTTSEPKGCLHTDATIGAAARGMGQRLGLIARDRNSLVFPITHIGGMVWMFASLQSGCANILTETFRPAETVDVLSREGVTLAGSGTAFHQAYVAEQRRSVYPLFPDVRAFPGGGAPKAPALFREVRELFEAPILSGYGLTEAPIITMADLSDCDEDLAHTEGRPQNGVEVRVTDPVGRIVEAGGEGELRIRAPQLMLGYLNPADNLSAFDDDGFFRSGDLGRIDARGNVVITGRVKDVIIRKGENISAKELEDLLADFEAVEDVAVIGLPDARSGERVCAVIQARDVASPPHFDDVVSYLRERGVITRKLPEQVEIVDLIPRNQSGKIRKDLLMDEFKGSSRLS